MNTNTPPIQIHIQTQVLECSYKAVVNSSWLPGAHIDRTL